MVDNKKKYQRKGISLKLLSWIISIFVLIFSGLLSTSLILISVENQKVTKSNENYIAIKQASNDVQLASDYLTSQVRLFVVNADKEYMDLYFEEANDTQRRQKAIETVHKLTEGTTIHDQVHESLSKAVDESMDLMNLEFFAMKLICVDESIPCSMYKEVYDVDVSSVPAENRKSEAVKAVLGTEYGEKKKIITKNVNDAFKIVDDLIGKNTEHEAKNLKNLIFFQTAVIFAHIVFVVVVILLIFFLIIRPMNVAFVAIESKQEVHVHANREFNYIVDAYNEARTYNEKVKEKLTYEAEHDKLTNLYNRTGYVSLYKRMRLSRALYMLIDIDKFKEINDKYGHDIGDRVLIRVAELLEEEFSEDNAFVFRIGGDEFTVLIENADESVDETIVERCESINNVLALGTGKIPGINLSFGIAHGDEDDTTDSLYRKADKAMYKAKKSQKNHVFYEKNHIF